MISKKSVLTFIFLICLSIPAVNDLFKPFAYTSHDLTHHIVRLIHLDKILKEGQIPPRWTDELNYGYGYPLFNFNYPLPAILGVIFHRLGFDYIWSVKMVFALSLVLSVFTSYLFFRLCFGNLAAILGSLFYLYAPIRFVNVYVSATLGNALAFAFVPLVFWAILGLTRQFRQRYIFFGGIGLASLFLSHNIMALIFVPVGLIFSLVILLCHKHSNLKLKKHLLIFYILGTSLSAFFLIPAIFEKKYIVYDQILENFYTAHFPTLAQLVHSHWGYGFSHPGVINDDMSFQIGIPHLLVLVTTLLLFFKMKNWLDLFFIVVFFGSVFLMLDNSLFLWKKIRLLTYVQMPWRFLALSVFSASFLAASLVSKLKNNPLLFTGLLILLLYANRNHLHINQILENRESYYFQQKSSTTMANEHLPVWVVDPIKPEKPALHKIEIASGSGQIKLLNNTSIYILSLIDVKSLSRIRLNQIYYPRWEIKVDGKPIEYDYTSALAKGFPNFFLYPGIYLVEFQLREPPLRLLSNLISVLAFLVVSVSMIIIIFVWIKKSFLVKLGDAKN